MAFIVLTSEQADYVRGLSPTNRQRAIEPRPTATGSVVNDAVLADAAHADVASFLSGLSTTASPSFSGTATSYNSVPARVVIGKITDLVLEAVSDTAIRVRYSLPVGAIGAEVSLNGGSRVVLPPDTLIGGLAAETQYSGVAWAFSESGRYSLPSDAVVETTLANVPTPSTVADLNVTGTSPTTLLAEFTLPSNWATAQYDVAASGTWLPLDISGLSPGEVEVEIGNRAPNTAYAVRVRGVGADGTTFGAASNSDTGTTLNEVAGFNPITTYCTAAEILKCAAAGATITPSFRWGPERTDYSGVQAYTGETFTPEPVWNAAAYDVLNKSGMLAREDFASTLEWLQAMDAQDKEGYVANAGSVYTDCNFKHILHHSIYFNPGATFRGNLRLFIQANGIALMGPTIENAQFFAAILDTISGTNSSYSSTRYMHGDFVGSGSIPYRYESDVSNFKVVDPTYRNVEYPHVAYLGTHRMDNIKIARGTYSLNTKAIITGEQQSVGRVEVYGGTLTNAVHDRLGSSWGTCVKLGSENIPNEERDNMGPYLVLNNHFENLFGKVLPKTDDNICCAMDIRGSNRMWKQGNVGINGWHYFYGIDVNFDYSKGTNHWDENFVVNWGSGADNGTLDTRVINADGTQADLSPGSQCGVSVHKGGGGGTSNNLTGTFRSSQDRNLIVWRDREEEDMPVEIAAIRSGHWGQRIGCVYVGHRGRGMTRYRSRSLIDSSSGANVLEIGTKAVDCGRHRYDGRRDYQMIYNDGGNPGLQIQDIRVNWDAFGANVTDTLRGVNAAGFLGNVKNLDGSVDLTNISTYAPTNVKRPILDLSGADYVLTGDTWGNGSVGVTIAAMAAHDYEWLIDGAHEPSLDDVYPLPAASVVGATRIQCSKGGQSTNGKWSRVLSNPIFSRPNLATAAAVTQQANVTGDVDNGFVFTAGLAETLDFAIPFEEDELYHVSWRHGSSSSGLLTVTIRGGNGTLAYMRVPLYIERTTGLHGPVPGPGLDWRIIKAMPGENALRFAGSSDLAMTISKIVVQKIS